MAKLDANSEFPPESGSLTQRGLFYAATRDVGARVAREGRIVHVDDVAAVPGYPEVSIRLGKQRTSLGVPLLREEEVIGTILLARQRVDPFTHRQIELVSTFADQAVIAMENARLINEQREALEQQTAMADVLRAINGSPGDSPGFDVIGERAIAVRRRSRRADASGWDRFRAVAPVARPTSRKFAQRRPWPTDASSLPARMLAGANIVHIRTLLMWTSMHRQLAIGPSVGRSAAGAHCKALHCARTISFWHDHDLRQRCGHSAIDRSRCAKLR
jgi:hypothetical protein